MVACSNSPRLLWLALALGLVGVKAPAAPQLADVSQPLLPEATELLELW